MSTRPQTRRSPTTHAAPPPPPPPPPTTKEREEDSETEDEEQEQQAMAAASRSTARTATSTSRLVSQVMNALRKTPPSTAALTRYLTATLANNIIGTTASPQPSPPSQEVRTSVSRQQNRNVVIATHVSPPAVAAMPMNSPQAGVSPPMTQGGGRSPSLATHSVANIDAQEDNLNDTSTLTTTETADAKAIRMLNQYFLSLDATGTVRSIIEERNLITNKLGLIFKKVKFINTDIFKCRRGHCKGALQGNEDS